VYVENVPRGNLPEPGSVYVLCVAVDYCSEMLTRPKVTNPRPRPELTRRRPNIAVIV